jgi:HAD superfamily hydrolase (TIGR01509 family)
LAHGVIFDCDGVLVNTEAIVTDIEIAAMAKLGVRYEPADFIARYVGTSMADFKSGLNADHHRVHGRDLPDGFFDALKAEAYGELAARIEALPGVFDFASSLAAPRAVASSSDRDMLGLKLRRTGLAELFGAHVHSAQDVETAKPAPDLYLRAARHLGVDPAQSLAIEDSASGVRAAVAAGMTCWGFVGGGHCPPGHGDRLRAAGAAAVFDHFDAIAAAYADGLASGGRA